MAVTITTLGTAINDKGSGAATISSVSASAGDYLVVVAASDAGTSITTNKLSGTVTSFYKLASSNNSGNVVTELWIRRLNAAISGATITFTPVGSDALAIAAYKINGLGDTTGSAVANRTAVASTQALNSGEVERVAVNLTLAAGTITTVDVKLSKSGSPTGTLYVRVRDATDDSILGTFGSIDVSTLTGTETFYTFNSSSVVLSSVTDAYLSIEYAAGDTTNYVNAYVGSIPSGTYQIGLTYSSGAWTLDPNGYAPVYQSFSGAYYCDPSDKTATNTGTSGSPSSGATDTLSQADEVGIGGIGMEGPDGDTAGSWTTGTGNISGNEQRLGTTGGGAAGNITVNAAMELLSATTAQTAAITGATSRDYAALAFTLKVGTTSTHYTKTLSLSAALKKAQTRTTSLSAGVQRSGNTKTLSMSSALAQGHTLTLSQSAALLKAQTLAAELSGALLKEGSVKTADLSAALQKAFQKTLSQDAALLRSSTLSSSVDAAILKVSQELATSLSAYLSSGITPSELTLSLSAALQEAIALNLSMSGALQLAGTATTSLEAALQKTQAVTVDQDAALLKAQEVTSSLDAALQSGVLLAADLDAYLVAAGTLYLMLEFSAALQKAATKTASLDSALLLGGMESLSLSSALSKATSKTTALDTALLYQGLQTVAMGAALAQGLAKTLDMEAVLVNRITLTSSLEAALLLSSVCLITVDAYLLYTPGHWPKEGGQGDGWILEDAQDDGWNKEGSVGNTWLH